MTQYTIKSSSQNYWNEIEPQTSQLLILNSATSADNNNRDIASDNHKPNDHQSDLKTNANLSEEIKERYISFINRFNW